MTSSEPCARIELTEDYTERTSVQAWRFFFISISGIAVAWIYKLSFHPLFTGGAQARKTRCLSVRACWPSPS